MVRITCYLLHLAIQSLCLLYIHLYVSVHCSVCESHGATESTLRNIPVWKLLLSITERVFQWCLYEIT